MESPYEILGVRRNASAATIKKAFRRLMAKNHPDANPGDADAAALAAAISAAYGILSDPAKRKQYDETGTVRASAGPAADIAAVIIPAMFEILNGYAHLGGESARRAVTDRDLIAGIRDRVNSQRTAVASQRDKEKNGMAVLRDVAARLGVDDGAEDLLAGAVRAQIAQQESQIAAADAEYDKLGRALDYLKQCRYRCDLAKPPDGVKWTRAIDGTLHVLVNWGT